MYEKGLLLTTLLALQQCVEGGKPVFCYTQRTSPSPKTSVRTISLIETVIYTKPLVVTVTPGITVTPSTRTTSTTITDITTLTSAVPQITETYTSTLYTTLTTTTTLPTVTIQDYTTTYITTTQTVQGTSTAAASAEFTPILNTLPGAAARKRSPNAGSLLAALAIRKPRPALCEAISSKRKTSPASWPATVTCVGVIETVTYKTKSVTAKTTTTATAPTPITTFTSTTTSTVTEPLTTPDASTTTLATEEIILTTTVTPVTTTTNTVSMTVTAAVYTATTYAQCAADSNNYAGTLNNHGITAVVETDGQDALRGVTTSDNSKEMCCTSCAANPLCIGSAFYVGFESGQQCYNFVTTATTCSTGRYTIGVYYNTAFGPREGYFLSNGNCGTINSNLGTM